MTPILEWIEVSSLGIEMLAIAIIVVAIVYGTGRYLLQSLARPPQPSAYDQYKVRLGKALLLGLEILVAADIVRTVALEPSIESVTVLGILVVIRTFLSWSLVVEIEGRWPWQPKQEGEGFVASAWAGTMTSAEAEKGLAMRCIRCDSERTRKDGQTRLGGQRWRCNDCGRRFTARSTSAVSHHGFPDDVIALAVRWYVRYRLSYADVVEWFAERGLVVDRSTVYRWVQRFLPLFQEAARAHRRQVGEKWRVDETYCRLNGKWTYIYRAIDQDGQVVDAYFSQRRNSRAAQRFFERAIDETGVRPERVTTDKAKCYPPALRAVLPGVEHRTSKFLNNGVERDHGHLKQRLYPMRGFKQASSAGTIARGHALIRNLRNGFSTLTAPVPINLRLAVAWPQLALSI